MELHDVDRRVDEDLAQQLDGRDRRPRQIGRVDPDDSSGRVREHARELPHEDAAPVVAADHDPLVAERGHERAHRAVQERDVVADVGLVAAAVAGHVGRDDVVARGRHRVDLAPPREGELGKAVEQQHQRVGGRAGFEAQQSLPVRDDVALAHGAAP